MVDLASYLVNGQTKTFMPLSSGIIEISMYSMTTETISVSITQHGLTRYLTVSPSGGIINAYCDIIVNTAAVSIRTYGTPVLRHAKFIAFKKFADDKNQCFPSLEKLSKITRMSRRKIQDTLKELEKKHVIGIEKRSRKDGDRN